MNFFARKRANCPVSGTNLNSDPTHTFFTFRTDRKSKSISRQQKDQFSAKIPDLYLYVVFVLTPSLGGPVWIQSLHTKWKKGKFLTNRDANPNFSASPWDFCVTHKAFEITNVAVVVVVIAVVVIGILVLVCSKKLLLCYHEWSDFPPCVSRDVSCWRWC